MTEDKTDAACARLLRSRRSGRASAASAAGFANAEGVSQGSLRTIVYHQKGLLVDPAWCYGFIISRANRMQASMH